MKNLPFINFHGSAFANGYKRPMTRLPQNDNEKRKWRIMKMIRWRPMDFYFSLFFCLVSYLYSWSFNLIFCVCVLVLYMYIFFTDIHSVFLYIFFFICFILFLSYFRLVYFSFHCSTLCIILYFRYLVIIMRYISLFFVFIFIYSLYYFCQTHFRLLILLLCEVAKIPSFHRFLYFTLISRFFLSPSFVDPPGSVTE